ncbi:hypothetical protein [Actinomadura rudentiformis]|uniref:Uncharacterized protein n=1 Tax=Actinomadura rudentiformis TaxID=359158 RepID=A0A6H9YMQ7_9ACTN|nr:hypothetical protein [Actinomadura rudentiformis]KAB2341007.1 hypothetical protein F8566_42660 [Actinomadura rudentiformis]
MAEPPLDKIKKMVAGDPANEAIKSGTLLVTRGLGTIAVALIGTFFLLDQLGDRGPWHGLSGAQKLAFVLGAGFIWSVVAASDALARGIAAGRPDGLVALPPGLVATVLDGVDSPGWRVVGVRPGAGKDGGVPEFLVAKGTDVRWLPAERLAFQQETGQVTVAVAAPASPQQPVHSQQPVLPQQPDSAQEAP